MAYLAQSLKNLRSEINARWPHRDKSSDGWIGDRAHQGTNSDHNPGPGGIVRAIDIDKDGIDPWFVVARALKHPSTEYVIFNRTIWSRSYGFKARRYTGSNPHDKHLHVSIRHSSSAYSSSQSWLGTSGPAPNPTPAPSYPALVKVLRRGSKGGQVRDLQARLVQRGWRIGVDGDFGPETDSVVRKFQREKHLVVDGIVGKATWKALWVSPITR